MSLHGELKNDLEMLNILFETAFNEIKDTKREILKDLTKLVFERFLDIADKENCLNPIKTAEECTKIELEIISKKPLIEIYEDLRLYRKLLNK